MHTNTPPTPTFIGGLAALLERKSATAPQPPFLAFDEGRALESGSPSDPVIASSREWPRNPGASIALPEIDALSRVPEPIPASLAEWEREYTPELHRARTADHGWTVEIQREGMLHVYALVQRRAGIAVMVSIDPSLDEEAHVFAVGAEGAQVWLGRAMLAETFFRGAHDCKRRHLGQIPDDEWRCTSEPPPAPSAEVWIKDRYERHGIALYTASGWRMIAGLATTEDLAWWAWMEADASAE